jgi:formylglycine-generating enzyme required for sulfatase activity
LLGITPLEVPRVKSGEVEYELRADGYTDLILEGDVRENEMLELFADMQERRTVVFGREWRNSYTTKFIPVGDVLMAATETRRREYNRFAEATSRRKPPVPIENPQQKRDLQFPVVNVDREDARAFCAWLTKREQDTGLIQKTDRYRLPSDEEWSRAIPHLPPERGKDPAERNGRARGIYPWGYEWPPPKGVDNFADISGARRGGLEKFIKGYDDKFPMLAAVTALPADAKGFVALAGNVSEWVDTDYEANPSDKTKEVMATVRGGNWRSENPDSLLTSARHPVPANTKSETIGFRIVLARGAAGSAK